MKAFIFNSGRGSRLGALTAERPKALVPLANGETLLARQLRLLHQAGVMEVVISTGYRGAQICEAVQPFAMQGMRFNFVDNPDYATSNAIVSLDHAAACLRGHDVLMMHGDLVFDASWLKKVMQAPVHDLAAVDGTTPLNAKDFKAQVREGRIAAIGVDLFGDDCVNFMPFYKLSARALALWLDVVHDRCAHGDTAIYAETAAAPVLEEMNLFALSYAGHLLAEVDTPADLEAVNARLC